MAKGPDGWFRLAEVTVAYDHASHVEDEHALLVDFTNFGLSLGARVSLELDLDSGRALLARLAAVIEKAESSDVAGC